MNNITTFVMPSLDRPERKRAIDSAKKQAKVIYSIDKYQDGAGIVRNKIIREANTEWVSMLDDDDTVTPDYVERLQEEIAANPDADVIIFREYFLTGQLLPNWPIVEWGNVGISFSVKREVALELPFKSEPFEDFEFIKRLQEAGKKIHFSKYVTYRVRH